MNKDLLENALKRSFTNSGDNWRGLCPFHDESTPSFFVHQEDLVAHCFGCGIGGTIDLLVAKYRGCSEDQARELLEVSLSDAIHAASRKESKALKRPTYYPESWLAPFKKEVHKYVVRDRGIRPEILMECESRFDTRFKRQVFPHRNRAGRLLGVTGRSCIGEDPKWYFYWGYDKGQALYMPSSSVRVQSGLRERNSQSSIQFSQTNVRLPLIIVEGVFDVLWLKQHGYEACACLGSIATTTQLQELKRIGTDFVLGLDNDEAGRAGNERIRAALRGSCRTQYVEWPAYAKDWMDLSKEQIDDVLGNTINGLQRQLIHTAKTSSRETR